jgi:hypothetical protein
MVMSVLMVVVGPNFQDAHFLTPQDLAREKKLKRRRQKLEGGTDVCKE